MERQKHQQDTEYYKNIELRIIERLSQFFSSNRVFRDPIIRSLTFQDYGCVKYIINIS